MEEKQVIYIATLISTYHGISRLDTRAIGWGFTMDEAEQHLIACGDECRWDHAVIEKVGRAHPIVAKDRFFYKIDGHRLTAIKEPFWAEGIINFGIG